MTEVTNPCKMKKNLGAKSEIKVRRDGIMRLSEKRKEGRKEGEEKRRKERVRVRKRKEREIEGRSLSHIPSYIHSPLSREIWFKG